MASWRIAGKYLTSISLTVEVMLGVESNGLFQVVRYQYSRRLLAVMQGTIRIKLKTKV